MAKVPLTITLYMSEIIYRVQNKTYLTGRSRQNGNNHEEVANMQNNDDEENKNQILLSIGNAFATLKTKLSEWLDEATTSASNAQIKENANLTLTLQMPSNYNKSTKDSIATMASDKGKILFEDSRNLALWTEYDVRSQRFRVYNCHFESYAISLTNIWLTLTGNSEAMQETGTKYRKSLTRRPVPADLHNQRPDPPDDWPSPPDDAEHRSPMPPPVR